MSKVQRPKSPVALITFVALSCGAQRWTSPGSLAQPFLFAAVLPTPQPKIVPDLNPAHATSAKTFGVPASGGPALQATNFAVNGYVAYLSWNPSPDTNVIAVRIYAGPDTDTPLLMFQVPVPGTNTSFFWPAGGSFLVWATAVDGAGEESDSSNVFTFVPPPPHTNIVLSWSPPRSNVLVESTSDLANWLPETFVDGSNIVFSLTNAPWRFYRVSTSDGGPPITNLSATLQ